MKRILFVCTGNTCRSPMAECLFQALLRERCLTDAWQAASAGIYAASGEPASTGARRAMERRGLSLDQHRSQPITRTLVENADCIVGMSAGHIRQLRMLFPECQTPMLALEHPPVADPYGGDDAAYERAAQEIALQLPALLEM